MRTWLVSSVMMAACFQPSPPVGIPCDSRAPCPDGQRCTTSGTCGTTDDPSLIAFWTFESIEGDRCADVSGNGHDAIVSDASLADGFAGRGLAIDGAPTSFGAVSLDAGVFGGGDLTVSLCVSSSSNLGDFDMPFFMGGSSAGVPGLDLELGFSNWSFNFSDGTGITQQLQPADESLAGTGFHCFAVKVDRDANLAATYLDGQRVAEDPPRFGAFPSGETLRFGGNTTNEFLFEGIVDEVRIYLRALDDAEISALHER